MNHGREKAVKFGTSASLVGVVTEPAPGSDSAGKPVFVMLNAGILHRVGSCRLHVRAARALSAAGFTTLRFDYSGIGDSDSRKDSLPFEESAVLETREAMDYLAKTKGAQRFVLMGLCSGADMAHETTVVDDRVVGLMLFDAWVYRTFSYYMRHYLPRLFKWRVWQNSIRIRLEMLMGKRKDGRRAPGGDGVEHKVPKYVRVFPPKTRVERDLKSFVDRGIAMYCVWTGGLVEYNHEGQFAEAFSGVRFGSLLREEHLETADHIMTDLNHQAHVVKNVVEWANGLPRAAAAAAATPSLTAAG